MSTTRPRGRRSVAHSHVDWLRLVEVSGPFLSLKVMGEAFPQGLERPDDDAEVAEDLRLAFDGWEDDRANAAVHQAFVRFMLERVLEYSPDTLRTDAGRFTAKLAEHGVSLKPDFVVASGDEPALLVIVAPAGASLEHSFRDGGLSASHAERMRLLLRATGALSGIVTSGDKWMLVHVPKDGTATFATWDTALLLEERETLRALRSLLGTRRVLAQTTDDSLDGLLARSADDEREVTDALGDQSRRVVEMLVSGFDAADREAHGSLLAGVEPPTLYEAVVAVTMRLIFLFTAEAQDLLPTDGAWVDSYAITPMRGRLMEDRRRDSEEVLNLRYDAWPQLLATFRAIHGGVEHEAVRLPGYGGGLFDPARYPFLEGVGGRTPRVSNAQVLRVLDDLQTLEVAVPGGRERRPLSFRALGVEQIGHVYERLLEHWAVRAEAPALGLTGSKKKEPEIALDELEDRAAQGETELIAFLVEQTGRSERAIMTGRTKTPDAAPLAALRSACDNEDDLLDRVIPYAGLIRNDHDRRPCVYLPGRVYVTERPGGRAFQSHYTPRSLTEPTVEYALEPIVFEGPAEGWEREDWRLREPHELLDLRICDIAVGSAAFLVAACRQLAKHLVESWARYPAGRPPELPSDVDEQDLLARRLIAERCLYGVDKNPLAIEIAKVSLWLTTLRKDRPFTFLDHALRVGDSLIGITDIAQLEYLSLSERSSVLADTARAGIATAVARAREMREAIASTDALDLRQVEAKQELLDGVERTTAALRATADLLVFAELSATGRAGADPARLIEDHLPAITDGLTTNALPDASLIGGATALLSPGGTPVFEANLRPLHWPLEFPEVFQGETSGFDMIVSNPPFLGGPALTGTFGTPYREYLINQVGRAQRGSADLCAYFVLRGMDLLAPEGWLSMLATNTIAQGDTRNVGLTQLTSEGSTVVRAIRSRKWPSEANLEIAQVWLRKGPWQGRCVLDHVEVGAITPYLVRRQRAYGDPHRLAANAARAFMGFNVHGRGFVMDPEHAQGLIRDDGRNRDVLFPYLTGEDLQTRPDQSPSRWIINFFDWPLQRAATYVEPFAIVERLVKPVRATKKNVHYRDRWWWYARRALDLSDALTKHNLAFARSLVSNNHCLVRLSLPLVASHAAGVFVADDWDEFAVIQSALHEVWVWRQASSLETRVRYTPSDCFETFPFPPTLPPGDAGKELHDYRAERTRARNEGLTALTNRINDPAQNDEDIVRLRELMVRLDAEVAVAYGWDDIPLQHGFHDTRIGRRFTICEEAREEIVDRLLELNHERYADEVKRGLHQPKKATKAKKKVAPVEQTSLLGEEPLGHEA